MRVIGTYKSDASGYYRITAPFAVLNYRTGHTFSVNGTVTQKMLEDYNVWWIHQPVDAVTEIVAREFQERGGKVVCDVDDWLFGLPVSWPCYSQFYELGTGTPTERLVFHERLLRLADAVTTTTEYLAAKLRGRLGEGKPIYVLPNCIVQGDWDVVTPAQHDLDGPVLGWFGTGNHWDDWLEIAPAVDEALERVGGHLALLGAPELIAAFPARLARRTLVAPLVTMRQFGEARRMACAFDVGLAWCTSRTEASKCRSPLKALQYGAAGVPAVVSEIVYGELWKDARTDIHPDLFHLTDYGMIARTPDELYLALTEALVYARPAARWMASSWQAEVWRSHSYEAQAMRWLDVCLKLT